MNAIQREFEELTLLVADDDPGFRETVVGVLEPYFSTISVESGEAAIEVVEFTPVSAVLIDMHMHMLTGLETLQWFRQVQIDIPCILMSSQVTPDLEQAAQELDVFSVIRKPPTRKLLLDTIHCALRL